LVIGWQYCYKDDAALKAWEIIQPELLQVVDILKVREFIMYLVELNLLSFREEEDDDELTVEQVRMNYYLERIEMCF
jgi:hypothetical protein